jgi:hypothetical protein
MSEPQVVSHQTPLRRSVYHRLDVHTQLNMLAVGVFR